MEHAVSAPIATRHLADIGARVVKVERPGGGDFTRHLDTLASGLGTHFTWVNRGKQSLTLDITKPGGAAVLSDLLARADVFVQNLAPGAALRAGIDGAALLTRHPRLVVCEISGYGGDGPFRDRRAYDLLIQCEAAVATITGSIEAPVKPGIAVADIAAGMYAYSSILAALIARDRTGRGCVLEVPMFDAVAEWMGYALTAVKHGSAPVFGGALSHPAIAPYDAFVTSDGDRVVLAVLNDREWARLATDVIGRADLATHPGFATNPARVRNREELNKLIEKVLAPLTAGQAIELLTAARIACARVNTVEQVVSHPQLVERRRWRTMNSPVGRIPTLLPPVTSSAWEPLLGALPGLGEHTDTLLAELGRDERAIVVLHDTGAV
jgi:crotonobetainyl-CoA:carnitine CoA-transferase CaiB-like acyl-CoA transferase